MPEFITSQLFLIIAAIFAIILVIGIAKRAVKLLIWVCIIFVILVCLNMVPQSALFDWFENLFKTVQ